MDRSLETRLTELLFDTRPNRPIHEARLLNVLFAMAVGQDHWTDTIREELDQLNDAGLLHYYATEYFMPVTDPFSEAVDQEIWEGDALCKQMLTEAGVTRIVDYGGLVGEIEPIEWLDGVVFHDLRNFYFGSNDQLSAFAAKLSED